VNTPGQDVEITPLGLETLAAGAGEQKRIVRERLLKLKFFELLVRLIKIQPDGMLTEQDLINELTVALPHEKPRQLFRTLLSWGRYSEIISYDQRRHIIRLYDTTRRAHRLRSGAPESSPVTSPSVPPADPDI
jgi:NitT/TauT family transport system ATP-binding protein